MNDNNKLTMDDNQNQQNQNANSTPTDNRGDSDSFDEQSQPGQPLDQPSSEQPYVNQPKRTRKKLVFIAVLLVIMILSGFGGAGIYYYFNKASKDQVVANDQSSQTNTDKASLTPAMITDQVKKAIAEVYPVVDDVDNTKLVNNQVSFKSSDEAPAWMVNNSKNYVRYSGNGASSTLVYINNNSGNIEKENLRVVEIQIGQIRRIMVDVLKGNNFALVTDNAYAKGDLFDAYQRDDVLCVAFKLNEENAFEFPTVNCGNLSKYTKDLQAYRDVEPFAKALDASYPTDYGYELDSPHIEDSKTSGYKTAVLGIGSVNSSVGRSAVLFYQKDGNDWRYFTGTQGPLNCTDFNTPEIRAAFKGTSCYDGETVSTVQSP